MQKNLAPVLERVCRSHCWIATPAGYRHIEEELDDYKIAAHLNGQMRYGACPIDPGTNTTRLGLLDLDSHKGETKWEEMVALAREIKGTAALVGLRATAVRSSGGQGIHLFFVWRTPQDAYSVRMALLAVLRNLEYANGTEGVAHKQIEIFPKQNSVPAGKCGSMFVLPYAGKSELLSPVDSWAESDDVTVVTKPERKNGTNAGHELLGGSRENELRVPELRGVQAVGEGVPVREVRGQEVQGEDRRSLSAADDLVGEHHGDGSAGTGIGSISKTGGERRNDLRNRDQQNPRGADQAVGSDPVGQRGSGPDVPAVEGAPASEVVRRDDGAAGNVRPSGGEDGVARAHAASDPVDTAARANQLHLLTSALRAIPDGAPAIEDRDKWLRVVFGVHDATGGSDDGLRLAHEFSARSRAKYDAEDLDNIWSAAGERGDNQVTAESVYYFARQYGWRGDVIADFDVLADSGGDGEAVRERGVGTPRVDGDGTIRPRFVAKTVGQYRNRPAPRWRVKDVIPDAELGFVVGESTSGKSFLALDLACSIARGVAWRGHPVVRGRVVYLVAEGQRGFVGRLAAYSKHHATTDAELADLWLIDEAPDLMKMEDAVAVGKSVFPLHPSILFIDTMTRVMPGANENAGEDMSTLLYHCSLIHKHTGAMVILVHHTGKDLSRGARGWSGFKGWSDVMLEVTRDGERRSVYIDKQKDGGDGAEMQFKLKTVLLDMDEDGEMTSSCVVEHVEGVSVAVRGTGRSHGPREAVDGALQRRILNTLDALGGQGEKLEPVPYQQLVTGVADQLPPPLAGKRERREERVAKCIERMVDAEVIVNVAAMISRNVQENAG